MSHVLRLPLALAAAALLLAGSWGMSAPVLAASTLTLSASSTTAPANGTVVFTIGGAEVGSNYDLFTSLSATSSYNDTGVTCTPSLFATSCTLPYSTPAGGTYYFEAAPSAGITAGNASNSVVVTWTAAPGSDGGGGGSSPPSCAAVPSGTSSGGSGGTSGGGAPEQIGIAGGDPSQMFLQDSSYSGVVADPGAGSAYVGMPVLITVTSDLPLSFTLPSSATILGPAGPTIQASSGNNSFGYSASIPSPAVPSVVPVAVGTTSGGPEFVYASWYVSFSTAGTFSFPVVIGGETATATITVLPIPSGVTMSATTIPPASLVPQLSVQAGPTITATLSGSGAGLPVTIDPGQTVTFQPGTSWGYTNAWTTTGTGQTELVVSDNVFESFGGVKIVSASTAPPPTICASVGPYLPDPSAPVAITGMPEHFWLTGDTSSVVDVNWTFGSASYPLQGPDVYDAFQTTGMKTYSAQVFLADGSVVTVGGTIQVIQVQSVFTG